MLAFTLSALIGNWICTSKDDSFGRFRYTFLADRSGMRTIVDKELAPGSPRSVSFTYDIGAGQNELSDTEVVTERSGATLTRNTIRIHGGIFEQLSFIYWNGREWAAPSMQDHFTCIRAPLHRTPNAR